MKRKVLALVLALVCVLATACANSKVSVESEKENYKGFGEVVVMDSASTSYIIYGDFEIMDNGCVLVQKYGQGKKTSEVVIPLTSIKLIDIKDKQDYLAQYK